MRNASSSCGEPSHRPRVALRRCRGRVDPSGGGHRLRGRGAPRGHDDASGRRRARLRRHRRRRERASTHSRGRRGRRRTCNAHPVDDSLRARARQREPHASTTTSPASPAPRPRPPRSSRRARRITRPAAPSGPSAQGHLPRQQLRTDRVSQRRDVAASISSAPASCRSATTPRSRSRTTGSTHATSSSPTTCSRRRSGPSTPGHAVFWNAQSLVLDNAKCTSRRRRVQRLRMHRGQRREGHGATIPTTAPRRPCRRASTCRPSSITCPRASPGPTTAARSRS